MAAELLITDVTLIDGTGGQPQSGVDVLMRDGTFAAVGVGAASQLAGGERIDGAGKWLIPGIWESHTHLRPLLREDPDASQPALDAVLGEYLAKGVTTVVDLGGPMEAFHRWRARQQAGATPPAAWLWFAGPSFTGVGGWPLPLHHNPSAVHQCGDAPTAIAHLHEALERGVDVVKIIYDGAQYAPDKLPREALRAIVGEVHQHGLHVVVHVHSAENAVDALEAGADGIEHTFLPTPGQEEAQARQITDLLARGGIYLNPTLAAWEQFGRAGDPAYLRELQAEGFITTESAARFADPASGWGQTEMPNHPKAETLERLRAAFRMLPAMHVAGVKFAIGSDVATVMSRPMATLREMVLLRRAGIPASDVLVAASRHAAEKIGKADQVGTIQPGQAADALLLDANPLDDLGVLVQGNHVVETIKAGQRVGAAART